MVTIHVHHHPYIDAVSEILSRLDALKSDQNLINGKLDKIMTVQADIAAALSQAQTDMAAQTTVVASLTSYVQGIQAALAALSAQTTDTTTAAALTALSQQMEANTASDAALIVQNTPAAKTS
jgi:chromosome segregation ATPase